jgi:hypothetical protein
MEAKEIIERLEKVKQNTKSSNGMSIYYKVGDILMDEIIQALSEEKVVSADFESALTYELSKLPYTKHLDDGQYNDGQINGFEMGARWMHDYAQQPSDAVDFVEWMFNGLSKEDIKADYQQFLNREEK